MNINRFFSFSTQRSIFSIVFTFLPISLSVGVLWNHLDSLSIFVGFYLILTKIGLMLVEITALFFLVWELSAKDKVLNGYCFFSNISIVLMMLLHVGAVFQYDSGIAKVKAAQTELIVNSSKMLELSSSLSTKQGSELLNIVKQDKNTKSNFQALNAVLSNTTAGNTELVKETLKNLSSSEVVNKNNIKTILPISYIESGTMYVVPILISFLLGVGALFISKSSIDAVGDVDTRQENINLLNAAKKSLATDQQNGVEEEVGYEDLSNYTEAAVILPEGTADRSSILEKLRA